MFDLDKSNASQNSWGYLLKDEINKPYFKCIMRLLKQQRQQGKVIYPAEKDIFAAFQLTSLASLKVVIIGQDPYHGAGQAHGLAFSVPKGIRIPPSLANIYKELKNDLGMVAPEHGCLSSWAKQGVLLLNTSLTVIAQQPASHSKLGWGQFTDHVIQKINDHKKNIIFLLWGNHAIAKQKLIDPKKHTVLTATHPSPFSAHRGFLGCKHFSATNQLLRRQGRTPIDWNPT